MKNKKLAILLSTLALGIGLSSCGGNIESSSKESSLPPTESSNSSSEQTTSTSSTEEKTVITSIQILDKESLTKTWYQNQTLDLSLKIMAKKGTTSFELPYSDAETDKQINISINNTAFTYLNKKITAQNIGAATLVVKTSDGTISDSVALICVNRIADTDCIILNGNEPANILEGEKVILPGVKAYLSDGTEVSESITLKDSMGDAVKIEDEEFVPTSIGQHTLTYSLKNPNTAKITTKSLSFTVYKKIIGTGGGQIKITDEKTDNPYATVTGNGVELAGFYIQPSKVYFAEATFEAASKKTINSLIALGNFVTSEKGGCSEEYLYGGLKINSSGNWEGYSKYNESGWMTMADGAWEGQELYTKRNEAVNVSPFDSSFTLGVARNGANFSFFINGVRTYTYFSHSLANKDTLPGLVMVGGSTSKYDGKITNIKMSEGEQATTNIAELEKSYHADYYAPWDGGEGLYSVDKGYGTFKDETYGNSQDGYSFGYSEDILTNNNPNYSMASPLVYMEGDFRLFYTMKINALEGGSWGKVMTDIRSVRDRFQVFGMESVFNNISGLIGEFNEDYWVNASCKFSSYPDATKVKAALGEDLGGYLNVTIERSIDYIDGTTFTVTLQNGSDPSKTLTFASQKIAEQYAKEPLVCFFKSQKAQVDISNFKVTTLE